MRAAVDAAAALDADVLCEEFVSGDEVTCPILGSGATARALPVIRIVAPEGNYDYQNKYFTDDTNTWCPPACRKARKRRSRNWWSRPIACSVAAAGAAST